MTDDAITSPVHPGEVLQEEYLDPLGLTPHRVAVAINVSPRRINEIVHGKRGITTDTALRLARFFGTTERFWLNLQGDGWPLRRGKAGEPAVIGGGDDVKFAIPVGTDELVPTVVRPGIGLLEVAVPEELTAVVGLSAVEG